MTRTFAVTWDYLCPFARNAHEHVAAGLQAGADWDVRFVPFSLKQNKVEEGGTDVWNLDEPTGESGILALLAGLVVRDQYPDEFLDAHLSLFRARHDDGDDIRDEAVVRGALERAGVDAGAVFAAIEQGDVLETFRKEHEEAANVHDVFGVPTFIARDDAVFVRLMNRNGDDPQTSIDTIERVVDLLTGWPVLNEFKHTRIPR